MISIVSNGVLMILMGLVYGTTISTAPYPQLALGSHQQMVFNGMIILLFGILVELELSLVRQKWQRALVWITFGPYSWIMVLFEVLSSHHGCKEFLKIRATNAGAPGCNEMLEAATGMGIMSTGVLFIFATAVLFYGCLVKQRQQFNVNSNGKKD